MKKNVTYIKYTERKRNKEKMSVTYIEYIETERKKGKK
jgi:hypothetical protein